MGIDQTVTNPDYQLPQFQVAKNNYLKKVTIRNIDEENGGGGHGIFYK
ncbi:hypothetical protein DSUL_40095 [Desulfovibrionales bacterium]